MCDINTSFKPVSCHRWAHGPSIPRQRQPGEKVVGFPHKQFKYFNIKMSTSAPHLTYHVCYLLVMFVVNFIKPEPTLHRRRAVHSA